jgi:hypothetical protein
MATASPPHPNSLMSVGSFPKMGKLCLKQFAWRPFNVLNYINFPWRFCSIYEHQPPDNNFISALVYFPALANARFNTLYTFAH